MKDLARGSDGTRQTVILAAGNGARLNGSRPGVPKPLVDVAGRPMIEHALRQARVAGCNEAVVVVGCEADLMRRHLGGLDTSLRITVVHNPLFDQPNGVSLLAAESYAAERFFLQMADHVFARPVLHLLDAPGAAPGDSVRLLIDYAPAGIDEDDATKVRVSDSLITAIGKRITPWDAVDAGCFRLDSRIFEALRQAGRVQPPSVSAGMERLATTGHLAAVPLEGVRWTDVDTPEDLARADTLLGKSRATPAGIV